MLDEKDIQALQKMMETIVGARAKKTEKLIDDRVEKTEKLMEDRATRSESLLLNEMERYNNKNSKKLDGLSKELDGLKDLYRMYKNENETINTLLRIIENIEKRVSELEKKTA